MTQELCENVTAAIKLRLSDDRLSGLTALAMQLVCSVLSDLSDEKANPRLKHALCSELKKLAAAVKNSEASNRAIYRIYQLVLEDERDTFWNTTFYAAADEGITKYMIIALAMPLAMPLVAAYILYTIVKSFWDAEKNIQSLWDLTWDSVEERTSTEIALRNLHNANGMQALIDQYSFYGQVAKKASSMWKSTCSFFSDASSLQESACSFFSEASSACAFGETNTFYFVPV